MHNDNVEKADFNITRRHCFKVFKVCTRLRLRSSFFSQRVILVFRDITNEQSDCVNVRIVQMFTNMFNMYLREGKLPNSWKDASVIIIHKKGDTADIKKNTVQ